MDLLDHAITILKSFDIEPRPLDRIVDAYFRKHRELNSKTRRLIAEVVFGVTRWRRYLDGLLSLQGFKKNNHRHRAVCFLLWKKTEIPEIFDIDELASELSIQNSFNGFASKKFPGGEAAFHSFPDFLYKKLVDAYGGRAAASLADHLNRKAATVLRINSMRASREEVLRLLANEGIKTEATKRSPYGLKLLNRADATNTLAFKKGLFEIQDEASQLAVIVSDPKPDELVLDACAGAGGKSLMMAMLMQNNGKIFSADIVDAKLNKLCKRFARANTNIITALPTKDLLKRVDLKGHFDLVLVDAPCSGTGTLRRNPDLKLRLDSKIIKDRVETQKKLLSDYAGWVKPGGRLVYVTCSVLPEENEEVVNLFLRQNNFHLDDVRILFKEKGIADDGITTGCGYFKTDPTKGEWDGFFAASFNFGDTILNSPRDPETSSG